MVHGDVLHGRRQVGVDWGAAGRMLGGAGRRMKIYSPGSSRNATKNQNLAFMPGEPLTGKTCLRYT
jgi:hypothetical protein